MTGNGASLSSCIVYSIPRMKGIVKEIAMILYIIECNFHELPSSPSTALFYVTTLC